MRRKKWESHWVSVAIAIVIGCCSCYCHQRVSPNVCCNLPRTEIRNRHAGLLIHQRWGRGWGLTVEGWRLALVEALKVVCAQIGARIRSCSFVRSHASIEIWNEGLVLKRRLLPGLDVWGGKEKWLPPPLSFIPLYTFINTGQTDFDNVSGDKRMTIILFIHYHCNFTTWQLQLDNWS